VVRARSEENALSDVQSWIITEGPDAEFAYDWALDMDEQELWTKSAIIFDSPVLPRLKEGEVEERQ
jgi:hypothetical protein